MLALGTEREVPGLAVGPRAPGAARAEPAVGPGELDVDGRPRPVVRSRPPRQALLPLGARHAPSAPVHRELGGVVAVPGGLPAHVRANRADDLDAVLGRRPHEEVGVDVPGVEVVLAGEEPLRRQPLVDRPRRVDVGDGRPRGQDVGDEVGGVVVAGLRQVRLVPAPRRRPLVAVPGLRGRRASRPGARPGGAPSPCGAGAPRARRRSGGPTLAGGRRRPGSRGASPAPRGRRRRRAALSRRGRRPPGTPSGRPSPFGSRYSSTRRP